MTTESSVSVLIADDEPAIRNGLNAVIPWATIPAEVTCLASDGEEAFSFIMNGVPDIAIVDIRMPRMNGLELIRKVREAGCKTEFIILSGYDDFAWAQQAITYGVRAYILKPFKKDDLLSEILKIAVKIRAARTMTTITTEDFEDLTQSSKKIFLTQLIRNEIKEKYTAEQKLYRFFPRMHNDGFFCIVVFIVNCQDEKSDCLLPEFIEKKMQQYPVAVWQYDTEHTVVLFRGNILGLQEIIRNCVSDACKDISCRISAGIGTSVVSVSDCHISFENALLALSYQLYAPDRTLFDNSVICTKAPPLSASRVDTLPLADAICRNDNTTVIAYMEVFFQSVFYTPMPPPGFLKGMCMFLITDIQKTLIKNTGLDQSAFPDSVYAEINRLSSFDDIKKWMISLFLHYSNETMVTAANNKNPFIEKAKQYIESHIESKILAEDVAAAVNLSTSYFTIYFKSKTGENFRDYLLNEKNEYAKKLLFHHDIPINEIAERLGYEDYRSFCRAFKKQEGITPSEYQQQYDIQRKKREERQD